MNMCRYLALVAVAAIIALPGRAAQAQTSGAVTPSHVHQRATDLYAAIELLREEMGVADYPPEAERQEDRLPIHAYAKCLEVKHKVVRVQQRLGVAKGKVGHIPIREIVPKDVLACVDLALTEVRRVKDQLVIEREIPPSPLVGGKAPADVYQLLGDVSLALDGLVGRPATPSDVYTNLAHLHDEAELVATHLKVALDLDDPTVEGRKRANAVGQQLLRASYKLVNLQTRLGMDASGVPRPTLVRVTPALLVDVTDVLWAEFVRVKAHFKIDIDPQERPDARGKSMEDVFASALRLVRNLDLLTEAAASL